MADINREVAKKGKKISESMAEKTQPSIVVGAPKSAGFPAQYVTKRGRAPYEEKVRYAKSLDPAVNPITTIPFTDEDVQTMKEREEMVNQRDFDEWVERRFDMYDKDTNAMIRKIYPEWEKSRLADVNRIIDLQKKSAQLGIRGLSDFEDLKYLYDAEHNQDLQDLLARAIGPSEAKSDAERAKLFKRGFFSEWLHGRSVKALAESKPSTALTGYSEGAIGAGTFPMFTKLYAPKA